MASSRRPSARTTLTLERETLHMMDGVRRVALVETKTIDTDVGARSVAVEINEIQMQIDAAGSDAKRTGRDR
ncbi:MAG: hypothetical protein QM820_23280 [Minicystis sp.]